MPYLRYFFLASFCAALLVVGWAGFRGETSTKPPLQVFPDMDDQAKVKYQAEAPFFADGNGGRGLIPGTVPMGLTPASQPAAEADKTSSFGYSVGGSYYHTGRFGDYWGDGLPEQVTVDAALIRRGGERYGIYCAVCHGYAGDAQGVAAKYGVNGIVNFLDPVHTDPKSPGWPTDGNMFNTITSGKGQMGPYGAMIPVADRWAIVSYIRTLQVAKASVPPPAAAPAAAPAAPTTK